MEAVMEYAFVFLIIFGAALLFAAACLAFSKDPRKSPLMARTSQKMGLKEAKKAAQEIAGCVAAVGLALILYCSIALLKR